MGLKTVLRLVVGVGVLALPSAAWATGTSSGTVRCDFPNGPIEGQPVTCTMSVTNTSTARHTYHMFGAFYEHGALRDECTGDISISPNRTATCEIFSGSFLFAGHHGVGVTFHVGLVDDNTGEGNRRLSITVLTTGSTSSETGASATY
jgi:hypothetical protein